jgi:hypothetical protein
MMLESRHCDGLMAHQDVLEEEGVRRNSGTPINKLGGLSHVIAVILESYVDIQDGIIMDFHYNGKLCRRRIFAIYSSHQAG